jgi:outer membrane translocation and assembly module TamA
LTLDLRHDQRDDPLLPRRGYKLAGNFELASVGLGGEVDYQRVDIDTSLHIRIARGQFLHLGLNHGVALTLAGGSDNLPFNKRFFPGGESSVRGYRQGEAAPRDSNGRIIGAETYTQGNLEYEQMLTPSWSLVVFVDGVGFARDTTDYPVEQALFSAGGGIRFKTIVGPVRLEYGRNLNPRRHDPDGTLHFSLGFPF